MDVQHIITIGIVLAAICYLGRYLFDSLKGVFTKNEGCGGGCAKCAFADNSDHKKLDNSSSGLIALGDIKTLPKRPTK